MPIRFQSGSDPASVLLHTPANGGRRWRPRRATWGIQRLERIRGMAEGALHDPVLRGHAIAGVHRREVLGWAGQ